MLAMIQTVIFYVFALAAVGSALVVVTSSQPVKAILFLVLTFIAMGGVWILLEAEFLALILIVVYVGAVMTLFLFVIMMLNLETTEFRQGWVRYLPLGIIMMILIMLMLFLVIGPKHFGLQYYPVPAAASANFSNVNALGLTLYTDYIYPFELAGTILLVAMIAAITLAFRGARVRRGIDIQQQLATTAASRLKLINMKSVSPSKENQA